MAYSSSGLMTDSAAVRSRRKSAVYRFSAVVAGTCLTQTTIFTLLARSPSRLAGLRHTAPLQELARDDEALDLLGSLVELGDLRVAHHALNRVVGDVAVSTQDLD